MSLTPHASQVLKRRESMTEKLLTAAQNKKTENFLLGYRKNKLMLQIEKYEQENFDEFDIDKYEEDPDVTNELIGARMEMYKIRHFIMTLPNGEEKLLLYFHYVHHLRNKCLFPPIV